MQFLTVHSQVGRGKEEGRREGEGNRDKEIES